MNTRNLLKKLPSCLLGALFVAGVTSTTVVNAVDGNPPGLFELEGNTVDGAGAGTDWDPLYTESLKALTDPPGTPSYPANMITYTGVIEDLAPKTIYWKGGSKDISDVPDWWQKAGGVPDKDDITNAYAAAFTNTTQTAVHNVGDMIIYFGLDRYANSGDAFAGFWFFQNEVAISGSQFSGQHKARVGAQGDGNPGDLLVLVEYPQAAGSHPEIKVYEWDPADLDHDNVAPNLDLLITQSNAECGKNPDGTPGTGDKLACAITNGDELQDAPAWPYTPKSGNVANLPFESFFEGGINVTQLLGTTPCFSAFLAETRASRSETATLKDFALGNFDVCGASVSKDCEATINPVGDQVQVDFTGSARNIGGLPLDMALEDDQAGSVITAVCFDAGTLNGKCDVGEAAPAGLSGLGSHTASFTLGAGQQVVYEGNYLVTQFDNQIEFSDTVTLEFFDDSGVSLGTVSDTASCPPVGEADIDVTKNCSSPRIDATGTTFLADISGSVENIGNVKLVNVLLNDVTTIGDPVALSVFYDLNKNGVKDGADTFFSSGGELAVGARLSFTGTVESTSDTAHEDTLTATGTNFFDDTDQDSDFATVSGCSLTVQTGLLITKACDTAFGSNGSGVYLRDVGAQLVVEVGTIITVTNTGEEKMVNVTIGDSQVPSLIQTDGPLMDCPVNSGQCTGDLPLGATVTFTQPYQPDGSSILGQLGNPEGVSFTNTATVQGQGALTGTSISPDTDPDTTIATATCKLCI